MSTLLLFNYQLKTYLSEENNIFYLQNTNLAIQISKKTGDIISLVCKNKNLLDPNNTAKIAIKPNTNKGKIVTMKSENRFPKFAKIYFKKEYSDKFVEYEFIIDSIDLCWKVEISSKIGVDKEINIEFCVPVINSMSHLFYPSADAPLVNEDIKKKKFIYRRDIIIPIITTYNLREDYGLTFVSPFEIPKPGL
ncbi:MAG: hypothetical protein ACFFDN_33235, partial [Candidatus Hodarchaeota archaeon]